MIRNLLPHISMNIRITNLPSLSRASLLAFALICIGGTAHAADRQKPPVNAAGMAVRDAEGHGINYTREELAPMESAAEIAVNGVDSFPNIAPSGFIPAGGTTTPPFWQYAIFGGGIGVSNIVIGPAPAGGGAREVIVGNYNGFWQVLRRNSATGNYDQLFVSPVYSAIIKRIARGNVIGDAQEELVVMLADGRIYYLRPHDQGPAWHDKHGC